MKGLLLFGCCLIIAITVELQHPYLAALILIIGFICLATDGFDKKN